jgi:Anti-sigma-K factor rskA
VTPDFDELVGTDLPPEERARLLRAHELLIAAGPLPELPPSLAEPRPPAGELTPFFNRRRHATIAVVAAAAAAAAFGIGYAAGHHGNGTGFPTTRTVVMHGTSTAPTGALASIALGKKDAAGNVPMLVRVSNLKTLPKGGYYELWLTRNRQPVAPCGSFYVEGGDKTVEVHFTVPYTVDRFDGWVVTKQLRKHHGAGPALLRTV